MNVKEFRKHKEYLTTFGFTFLRGEYILKYRKVVIN